jgi:hypothetical protein
LLLAYLRKSSQIFFVSNYLVNLLPKQRNKPNTIMLCTR